MELKDLQPASDLIEKLAEERRPFYLSLIATRCLEALWAMDDPRAMDNLRRVVNEGLAWERSKYDAANK